MGQAGELARAGDLRGPDLLLAAPGFDQETFIFGLAHGIGYIALCILIWIAILRHEAPYTLLAATLTPVGPLGSVIAIEVIERKRRA